MARQKQDGLKYFSFDTDFFYADKRISKLHKRFGNNGIVFYIYLLTEIYRNGYYSRWTEDLIDDAIDLNLTEGFIEQAMTFLISRSLITKITLTNPDTVLPIQKAGDDRPQCELANDSNGQEGAEVITSPGIQRRYQEAVKNLKRDIFVNGEIWLLSDEETASYIKVVKNENKSEKKEDKSEKNKYKSEKNDVKEIKIKENKINDKNTMCKAEALALFERLWILYPNKKGKGQVSDKAKLKLLEIGYDEIVRAIDRYKTEWEKDKEWRKPQNGSTFFNSGYIDYLDANYEPSKKKANKNQFNNFHQREYDYDAMEKLLLERK